MPYFKTIIFRQLTGVKYPLSQNGFISWIPNGYAESPKMWYGVLWSFSFSKMPKRDIWKMRASWIEPGQPQLTSINRNGESHTPCNFTEVPICGLYKLETAEWAVLYWRPSSRYNLIDCKIKELPLNKCFLLWIVKLFVFTNGIWKLEA